jgi:hypothetical protein
LASIICRGFGWGNARKALQVVTATRMALSLVCLPLFSQARQSAIQGALLDQSGGAIAGAAVTVIDVARGSTRALVTIFIGWKVLRQSPRPPIYQVSSMARIGLEIPARSCLSMRSRNSKRRKVLKAQDGWKEGSVISIAVKSGTNTIHGTVYALGRDAAATDARNYAFRGREL